MNHTIRSATPSIALRTHTLYSSDRASCCTLIVLLAAVPNPDPKGTDQIDHDLHVDHVDPNLPV